MPLPVALPVPGAPEPGLGFTAVEPLVFGAGEGEFSMPLLPVDVPAPPVPVVVPVPGCVAPAVPVPIGAPALPPRLPAPEVPVPVPAPPVDCANAATGPTAAAPAKTPVLTHRHTVRLMTAAFSPLVETQRRYGP